MMQYLICGSQNEAEAISAHSALRKGTGEPIDTTKYWYAIQPHPTTAQWAVVVHDGGVALTPDQQLLVIDALPSDWTPA
jgi:hypothetical protein